jgi:hypothetical protein
LTVPACMPLHLLVFIVLIIIACTMPLPWPCLATASDWQIPASGLYLAVQGRGLKSRPWIFWARAARGPGLTVDINSRCASLLYECCYIQSHWGGSSPKPTYVNGKVATRYSPLDIALDGTIKQGETISGHCWTGYTHNVILTGKQCLQ